MEGITFLKNESNNHGVTQIDLTLIEKDKAQLKDLHDLIAIEVCKNKE